MLGRFLELSVPAPKILESWHYYQALGFGAATVGETWSHRYAVVSDGRLAIGLHDAPLEGPLLTYACPDLAGQLDALEAAGVRFDSRALGAEVFNEAGFRAPSGLHVRLVEARTYSPPERPRPSHLGWFEELALPAASLDESRQFWERLGFVTAGEEPSPWPHLSLTSDTLNLGLYGLRGLEAPALVFGCEDVPLLRQRLEEAGIEPEPRLPRGLDPAAHVLLVAPEGTQLLVGPPSS